MAEIFFITQWIAVVVGCAGLVIFGLAIVGASGLNGKIYESLNILDTMVLTVTSILVIRIVKIKDQQTPKKVIKLILTYAFTTVVLTLIQIYLLYKFPISKVAVDPELQNLSKGTIKTLLWAGFWMNYFKKSKRVISYYELLSIPAVQPQ